MTTTPRRRRERTEGPREVAEGVYRLGTKWLNFYLVEDDGEFTLIDAGYRGYWHYLTEAIDALGTSLGAIRAVILTHHHVDHVGTAQRLRSTVGARVFVGEGDLWIVVGKVPVPCQPGVLSAGVVAAERDPLYRPQRRSGRWQLPTG